MVLFGLLDTGLLAGSSRSERMFTADESTGPSGIIPTPVEARIAASLESPRDTEGRMRDLDLEPGRCILLVIPVWGRRHCRKRPGGESKMPKCC